MTEKKISAACSNRVRTGVGVGIKTPPVAPVTPFLLHPPPPPLQVERPTYDEWLLKRKEDEGNLASVADIEEKRMRECRAGCGMKMGVRG